MGATSFGCFHNNTTNDILNYIKIQGSFIVKKYLILIVGLVIGCGIATVFYFSRSFSIGIANADWSTIVTWLSIIVGAAIPILINHYSIKKQEVIKIKAKMASDRIDDIYRARDVVDFMKITVITDFTVNNLGFPYEQTPQDASAPTLRASFILQSHEHFSDWRIKQHSAFHILNKLNYPKLNEVLFFCSNYILNLVLAIESVPDTRMPIIGIAVKNDFFMMHDQISDALDAYFENELFKLKYKVTSKKGKPFNPDALKTTNLHKYRAEFAKLI